jgi:hypothetical protein
MLLTEESLLGVVGVDVECDDTEDTLLMEDTLDSLLGGASSGMVIAA